MSKEILEETSGSLTRAATEARGLAIDAVHACSSGHLGLPLGCAEIGAVLFGHTMRYNPAAPGWLNRDRFILSAGHVVAGVRTMGRRCADAVSQLCAGYSH